MTGPDNVASRRVMEKCGFTMEAEYLHPDEGPSVRYVIHRAAFRVRSER